MERITMKLQVKHDTLQRTWKTLSVSAKEFSTFDMYLHIAQYATDNQMNPDCIAIRSIDPETGNIIRSMDSIATQNKRK